MTTREENIKKINDELEKLDDEQLEQVAGGTYGETEMDSKFLYKLGLLDRSYTADEIMLHSDTSREQKIYDAFQKLGIGYVWHGAFSGNGYYFGQQSLTQSQAWKVAEEQAKRLKLGKYSE